jgi:HSF-type DNA-binding
MCVTNTLRHRHVASQGLLLKLAVADGADSAAAAVPQCPTDANDDKELFNVKANPKARRGALKPGMTAMNHTRRFVVHEYHDRAPGNEDLQQESFENLSPNTSVVFPTKLHLVLNDAERSGWEHIISWSPHGRCFMIHNPNEFVAQIMPK